MRPLGIEVNAPLLYECLGFTQAIEQLAIEELIPELAFKALAVAVLPWSTWDTTGGNAKIESTMKSS